MTMIISRHLKMHTHIAQCPLKDEFGVCANHCEVFPANHPRIFDLPLHFHWHPLASSTWPKQPLPRPCSAPLRPLPIQSAPAPKQRDLGITQISFFPHLPTIISLGTTSSVFQGDCQLLPLLGDYTSETGADSGCPKNLSQRVLWFISTGSALDQESVSRLDLGIPCISQRGKKIRRGNKSATSSTSVSHMGFWWQQYLKLQSFDASQNHQKLFQHHKKPTSTSPKTAQEGKIRLKNPSLHLFQQVCSHVLLQKPNPPPSPFPFSLHLGQLCFGHFQCVHLGLHNLSSSVIHHLRPTWLKTLVPPGSLLTSKLNSKWLV